MKKVAIVTITGNNNYGNRLQNYAVEKVLEKIKVKPYTLWNKEKFNICNNIKNILKLFFKRSRNFKIFTNKYTTPIKEPIYNVDVDKYDYFIIGSDQILTDGLADQLKFLLNSSKEKNIAFAASYGTYNIRKQCYDICQKIANNISYFSVREDAGKKIAEELTGRTDVEVLVDPTMLLTPEEWDKVAKKPKQLKTDKYILNYFLGELSESRKNEINRIAKENDCEVINILDKNSPFYTTGPSEFLYLEKHAFLICTDSFHSSVFALLYNRPFIIFNREDNKANMNSRIDTLINKFNLKNRRYEGKITEENLNHDYTEAYKILEKEREKSEKFLKKALNIEE